MSYTITELDGKPTGNQPEVTDEATTETTSAEVPTEATAETTTTEQTTAVGGTETEAVETEEESGLFWGEIPVEVSIPDEVNAAFEEKGIDGKAILGELFAKDGKFELKEDTKAKLYEAFGKPLVDGYLNLYKGQNEMAVAKHQAEFEAQQAVMAGNAKEFSEMVSDEQWGELDAWCAESLPEQELAAFNAVMSLPAEHWAAQKAVLQTLMAKHQASLKDSQGDGQVKLLGDDSAQQVATKDGLPSTLTKAEFQELMHSDRYRKEGDYASRVDAIRRSSMQAGIR